MSDTPRTDANAGWFVSSYGIIRSDGLFTDHDGPFVHANFARELERENAALRNALTKIRSLTPVNMACDHWSKYYGLEPEQVFDLCDEVLGKEAQP